MGLRPLPHPQDPTVSQGLRTQTCPTFTLVIGKIWGPTEKKVTESKETPQFSLPGPASLDTPTISLNAKQTPAPLPGGSFEAKWGRSVQDHPIQTQRIHLSVCLSHTQIDTSKCTVFTQTLSPQSRPLPRKSKCWTRGTCSQQGFLAARGALPAHRLRDSPGPH